VTGADETRRLRRALPWVLAVFALGFVYVLSGGHGSGRNWDEMRSAFKVVAWLAAPLLLTILLMFRRAFFPEQTRRYVLDAGGITVRKGSQARSYPWSDFVSYTAGECLGPLAGTGKQGGSLQGPPGSASCFYLLERGGFLRRTMLIIEPAADNREGVGAMLGAHLEGAQHAPSGFVRYVKV
jgi:hypothetical protein